jgi:hypothetical protein
MRDLKELVVREIRGRRERIRGVIVAAPRQAFFDPAGTASLTWVVDVDVGSNELLRDVPVKINGPQARMYARLGMPVYLDKDAQGRYQVVAPADRVPRQGSVQELDEDAGSTASAGQTGFTFVREPFSFYGGPVMLETWPNEVANLVLWLDAKAYSSLSLVSGAVERWTDRSGAGNDAVQTLSTYRPLYASTGGPNGTPTIDFDGSNDFLTLASHVTATAATIFLVAAKDVADSGDICLLQTASLSLLARDSTIDQWGAQQGAFYSSGVTLDPTFRRLVAVYRSVADFDLRTDGQASGTFSGSTGGGATTRIGASSSGYYLDGKVCELLIYDRALSLPEVQAIESYLAAKWTTPGGASRWNNGTDAFPKVSVFDAQGNPV